MKLRAFNWELVIRKSPDKIRQKVQDKIRYHAIKSLAEAEFNLAHHTLLKQRRTDATEAEIKGFDNAIEQDKKTITNFKTQLETLNN